MLGVCRIFDITVFYVRVFKMFSRRNALMGMVFAMGMMTASAHAGVNGVYQTQPNEEGSYLHVEVSDCADNKDHTCGTILAAYNSEGEANEDYEHLGKLMIPRRR